MERLNRLTTTLNTIRQLAQDMISKALPIMKELESPDSDLVNEFLEEVSKYDKHTVVGFLREISLELIADAQTVNREIENFSDSVIYGDNGLIEGKDEYPFLLEVWYGDTYDCSEIKGLEALAQDLESQFSRINEDMILIIATTRYK